MDYPILIVRKENKEKEHILKKKESKYDWKERKGKGREREREKVIMIYLKHLLSTSIELEGRKEGKVEKEMKEIDRWLCFIAYQLCRSFNTKSCLYILNIKYIWYLQTNSL